METKEKKNTITKKINNENKTKPITTYETKSQIHSHEKSFPNLASSSTFVSLFFIILSHFIHSYFGHLFNCRF